jgi:hypothetical protein
MLPGSLNRLAKVLRDALQRPGGFAFCPWCHNVGKIHIQIIWKKVDDIWDELRGGAQGDGGGGGQRDQEETHLAQRTERWRLTQERRIEDSEKSAEQLDRGATNQKHFKLRFEISLSLREAILFFHQEPKS